MTASRSCTVLLRRCFFLLILITEVQKKPARTPGSLELYKGLWRVGRSKPVTWTSVRPEVALTSGGNGEVEAGADGRSFSDDPAWSVWLWLFSILNAVGWVSRDCLKKLFLRQPCSETHFHILWLSFSRWSTMTVSSKEGKGKGWVGWLLLINGIRCERD